MKSNCYKCDAVLTSDNRVGGKNPNLCKSCKKEYDRKWHLKNRQKYIESKKARHQERMANDPEYKENRNTKNRERRANNPNYAKEQREYRAKNNERVNMLSRKARAKPDMKIKRAAECRNRQARKQNATYL